MTSHFIERFSRRANDIDSGKVTARQPPPRSPASSGSAAPPPREVIEQKELAGLRDEDCVFCGIVADEEPARTVYEDDLCIAFFDIYPIRPGHTLLIPKAHYERVPHLPDDLSAHLGRVMPRLCRALGRALEQPDMNIVSNQGYAQVVPHIHFHLVPAPKLPGKAPRRGGLPFFNREDLDDDTADALAQRIREAVANEEAERPLDRSGSSNRGRL
ncbi:hypothetical protein JCM8202_005208 [Rhodotorula sphaerocarpa]